MKKIHSLLALIFACTGLLAQEKQDTTHWKIQGQASVNFSQVAFSNWVAGGKNSVSGVGFFHWYADYQKGKTHWKNALKTGYGLLKEEGSGLTKTDDRLEIHSKGGLESKNKHLLYSAYLNFTTQFARGYKTPNATEKISDFFAPAYLTIAAGMDYQPSSNFSLFVMPVSGKLTLVFDEELSAAGAFGVEEERNARMEFGGSLKSEFKTPVVKNVNLSSSVVLFSNYLNNPENIDVNWDLELNMKINEFLSANFMSTLIYDHDILIPLGDGETSGRRIQLKQLLGVGLSYNF